MDLFHKIAENKGFLDHFFLDLRFD